MDQILTLNQSLLIYSIYNTSNTISMDSEELFTKPLPHFRQHNTPHKHFSTIPLSDNDSLDEEDDFPSFEEEQ